MPSANTAGDPRACVVAGRRSTSLRLLILVFLATGFRPSPHLSVGLQARRSCAACVNRSSRWLSFSRRTWVLQRHIFEICRRNRKTATRSIDKSPRTNAGPCGERARPRIQSDGLLVRIQSPRLLKVAYSGVTSGGSYCRFFRAHLIQITGRPIKTAPRSVVTRVLVGVYLIPKIPSEKIMGSVLTRPIVAYTIKLGGIKWEPIICRR
jgi:hypothetical protein